MHNIWYMCTASDTTIRRRVSNGLISEELKMLNITGNADPKEAQAYVDYLQTKYNRKLESLDVQIDGDYADLKYRFEQVPFERIRRITGYLVGTLDRFNNGKRAEVEDRVKHGLSHN